MDTDLEQFKAAQVVGKSRPKRLANLIGYCCEGDERLLVAEYMPSDTLAKLLFHWEKQIIEWLLRLRVALYIAEVLDYCNTDGLPLYHDLNAYRILFDEDDDPHLSCFSTNLAYKPPEYLKNARVTPESVICSFGTFLDLLSRKHIPPSHALDMISPTVYSQCSVRHLFSDHSDAALLDAMQASVLIQIGPQPRPSLCSQLHFFQLDMQKDAADMLLEVASKVQGHREKCQCIK